MMLKFHGKRDASGCGLTALGLEPMSTTYLRMSRKGEVPFFAMKFGNMSFPYFVLSFMQMGSSGNT